MPEGTVRPLRGTTQLLAAAGAAVAVVLLTPLAAEAAPPVVREPGTFSGEFVEPDLCGMEATVTFDVTFRDVVRAARGSTEAFLLHSSYTRDEVIVLEDGTVLTATTKGRFIEQHATQVSGSVYRFESQETRTFVLRDEDGSVLLRENGVVKISTLFDTAVLPDGTPSLGEPGGTEIPGSFVERARHGRTTTEEEFCAAVSRARG